MPKRRRSANDDDGADRVPSKALKSDHEAAASGAETSSGRKSILKVFPDDTAEAALNRTPKSSRNVLFSRASETPNSAKLAGTLPTDRSAQKKSRRTLRNAATDNDSDADVNDENDELLAREILGENEEDDEDEDSEDAVLHAQAGTPSKTLRPRGRPKGRRRERTPTPPPDLPSHELFFFQNRPAGNKTSTNTLASHLLLNHEDYGNQIRAFQDPHGNDIRQLKSFHTRAFDQWTVELDEGFNVCLYGYGSKRELAMDFAKHVHFNATPPPRIVVVNGYTPGLTIKDVLTSIAGVVVPKKIKLPAQPVALLELICLALNDTTSMPNVTPVMLFLHSLDHVNLRRSATQSMLARLASLERVWIVATCDSPNFSLLWDVTTFRQYRFICHDATTFDGFQVEIDAVEDCNTLLGRGSRRLGGKDGVGYVLKSLPENARSLFRILVAEQLALADQTMALPSAIPDDDLDLEDILGVEDEDEAARLQATPSRRGRGRPPRKIKPPTTPRPTTTTASEGVEYRTLYHKAVEEFVCSSELNFRTLLKEFHDHQMVESRKDAMGTERLVVPFRKEDLESILEELVG